MTGEITCLNLLSNWELFEGLGWAGFVGLWPVQVTWGPTLGWMLDPGGSEVKASAHDEGDPGSILGSEDPLEKEMATHSSILAWRIPETGESGGLPSLGSHRVRQDWSDLAAAGHAENSINDISFVAHSDLVMENRLQKSKGNLKSYMGLPDDSDGKASACNAGNRGSISGSEDPLEKEMATHSSTLAWKIPWMEESGGLQSMGSQRVGHNWATSFRLKSYIGKVCKNRY